VGAVAVAVGVGTINSVVEEGGASPKLGVGGVDASIDDIGASTCSSAGVVDVAGAARRLVREACNAPRSACLRRVGVDLEDRLLLNVLDLPNVSVSDLIRIQRCQRATYIRQPGDQVEEPAVQLGSETPESITLEDAMGLERTKLVNDGIDNLGGSAVLQLDDILVRNDCRAAGSDDRGGNWLRGRGRSTEC
jgi:hypothetical protein